MLLINSETAAMIGPLLDPGEQIVWSDRPKQGLLLRKKDVLLIPFSVLWGGFAIFWEIQALGSGGPDFFPLFGIPFVVIGLYLMIGRFFHDSWRRRRVAYAVTDRRLVILSAAKEQSIALHSLDNLRLEEHRETRGTVATGPEESVWQSNNFGIWTGAPSGPTLERIENAREVYALLRRHRGTAPQR